jgi:hypothetical protein
MACRSCDPIDARMPSQEGVDGLKLGTGLARDRGEIAFDERHGV